MLGFYICGYYYLKRLLLCNSVKVWVNKYFTLFKLKILKSFLLLNPPKQMFSLIKRQPGVY